MKKITLLAGLILLCAIGNAQNVPNRTVTESNTDLSADVAYALENLDMTEVSSGILLERGFPMRNPAPYDGTLSADTLYSYNDWFFLYGTMVTSVIDPSKSIGTTADWKPETDSLFKSEIIPVMAMHLNYHKFLEDTVQLANQIYLQNGQYFDQPNQTASPYEEGELFTFSTKRSTLNNKLSWDFVVKSDFFITNTSKTPASVQIDFDNGQGYQNMSIGTPNKISWTTYGKKYLKLKITYTDATVRYATSLLKLGGIQTPKYNSMPDDQVMVQHPIYTNYGANLKIAYGCGNDKLVKPFIYVEGFNPELFESTYQGLIDDLTDYQESPIVGYHLLDELKENGYDIVYVDFVRGTGDLLENAKTLENVIKKVNEIKEANGSGAPNVVAGYSMGGVIARLALTQLEIDGYNHQTSYYISVDSPHLGANIPRGIIESAIDVYYLTYAEFNVSEDIPALENMIEMLYSKAARQMLIDGVNWPDHIELKDELAARGMPLNTLENIAISKGNGNGTGQGFGSMDQILKIDIDLNNAVSCADPITDLTYMEEIGGQVAGWGFWLVGYRLNIEIDINAGPGYVNYPLEIYGRKLRIKMPFNFDINPADKSVKVSHRYFYDGAQGGNFGINSFNLPMVGFEESDDILQDLLNGDFAPCVTMPITQFSFIPTFSALAIESMLETPSAVIDPAVVMSNNQTSFDKVYLLDPSTYPSPALAPNNESHLDFTPSNVFPFSTIIPPAFSVNSLNAIEAFTYNFGRAGQADAYAQTSERITKLIDIGLTQTGTMCINCNGVLDISSISINPQNEAAHFAVELTENCDSENGRLNIGANGILKIGENTGKTGMLTVRENSWIELNDGLIEVRENSKLIIESGAELRLNGGQLKVYDGGEVIIKEGGFLRYEDGVTIELNGNNAQLALGGLTHIGDDATFRFFWQGSESGYVRLLKEGHWGQRFSAGTNAQIRLEGEGQDDLILYMEEDADLWEYIAGEVIPNHNITSNLLESIFIQKGKVLMEQGARIVFLKHGRIFIARLEPVGNQVPRGVEALHKCEIIRGDFHKIKLTANMHYAPPGLNYGRLFIDRSTFNEAALKIRGRYFDILSSDFWSYPIDAEQCNALSTIRLTNFNKSAVIDNSPSDLLVRSSLFEGFVNQGLQVGVGVSKSLGRLTLKCNDFKNLMYAVQGFGMASLNLSTLHGGGYNYFQGNGINIYFLGISDFILEHGYNEFNAADIMNIYGFIGYTSSFSCFPIDATLNIWNSQTSYSGQNNIWVSNGGAPICTVSLNIGDPNEAQPASCGEHDPPGRDPSDPVEPPLGPGFKNGLSNLGEITYPLISTDTYFLATPYDVAMQLSAAQSTLVDSLNGDNITAAAMYHELLEVDLDFVENDSLASVIERMSWQALHAYKGIIELLLADSVISQEANQITFESVTQAYANTLMAFTDSVKTPENYGAQFDLELMKTSLFLSLNKPNIAYSILANMDYCDHDSLERAVLTSLMEQIAYDIYASELGSTYHLLNEGSFELDSAILANLTYSAVDTSTFGTYIVDPQYVWFSNCDEWSVPKNQNEGSNLKAQFNFFPNPTSFTMNVEIYRSDMPADLNYEFRLYDLQGKLMLATQLQQNWQQVSLPKLPSALYLGAVYSEGLPVYQQKVNIMH